MFFHDKNDFITTGHLFYEPAYQIYWNLSKFKGIFFVNELWRAQNWIISKSVTAEVFGYVLTTNSPNYEKIHRADPDILDFYYPQRDFPKIYQNISAG